MRRVYNGCVSQAVIARCSLFVAALAAVGACNQVFGVRETGVIDADTSISIDAPDVDVDDDGVLDVVDVCPAIANPLQEDMDRDRIGDACDPCPAGSNHNEDGDDKLDGCDNCPQIANNDQANTDGDALGDACDTNPEDQDVRNRFDGFEVLGDDWIPARVDWKVDSDAAVLAAEPDAYEIGIWNRHIEVKGSKWSIETRVHFTLPVVDGDSVAIHTRFAEGTSHYICFVQYADSGQWTVGTDQANATFNAPDGIIKMRIFHDGIQVSCQANDVTVSGTMAIPFNRTYPGFGANTARGHIEYVDAVSTPP
jgi:hypothetical protein